MPKNIHAKKLSALRQSATTPAQRSEIAKNGGLARAKSLTQARRTAIAKAAGQARAAAAAAAAADAACEQKAPLPNARADRAGEPKPEQTQTSTIPGSESGDLLGIIQINRNQIHE